MKRQGYGFSLATVGGLCCLMWLGAGSGVAADPVDTGFESDQARGVRKAAQAQEWVDTGLELADIGEKAKTVKDTLERIRQTDQRMSALKRLPDAERSVAEQREMQHLMSSLKDDARSLGSGSLIVSTLVDQLKAKLPVISARLRDIDVPPKADFSFLKQTALEAASPNPKDACGVVTRLTEGKQGLAQQLAAREKTIEALNGVETRLGYAEHLVQQVLSLMNVPIANIPVYYAATDLMDLQEAIGPVVGDVQDKRRQLERARDLDKTELAAREPEIDRTIALYRAKHKTDPCQAAFKEARLPQSPAPCPDKGPCLTPKAEKQKSATPLTKRTVPTLSDPCLSYTVTSRSSSYVNIRIENTCERESVKIEHACTGIGLRPVCSTCDEWTALWKSAGSKTCLPEK